MLVRDGITLVKIWLNVCRAEQLRRFMARERDPLKQWKLSWIDVEGLNRWKAYTHAIGETFQRSHTESAPWTIILADDKRRARLAPSAPCSVDWIIRARMKTSPTRRTKRSRADPKFGRSILDGQARLSSRQSRSGAGRCCAQSDRRERPDRLHPQRGRETCGRHTGRRLSTLRGPRGSDRRMCPPGLRDLRRLDGARLSDRATVGAWIVRGDGAAPIWPLPRKHPGHYVAMFESNVNVQRRPDLHAVAARCEWGA